MGNRSSKKSSLLCCPCTFNKSARSVSTLSIDEKCFPTFDRLSIADKPSQLEPCIDKRRSVSLHNVIVPVLEDIVEPIIPCKPPLPPGKGTVHQARRSFRANLGQNKRTYYSQSIEHARLSIEDLEKSLHGAASIDQWIDSLPMLGTPSLNRNKTDLALRRPVASAGANQKIKRSLTLGDHSESNMLDGSYRQVSHELSFHKGSRSFRNMRMMQRRPPRRNCPTFFITNVIESISSWPKHFN
jgi:hypothetical protein